VNELDIVEDFKAIRKLVGYMPGKFSLYQDLTILENLEFFATTFGTTIEQNYDLIKDIYIQIEPFKNRLAGKLSGGMKQKLALCCALIHKPEILVLDEPTTGVDAVSRKEFWEMLIRLKEKGISIIVSTPYMDEAEMCDKVALIQNGEILKINTPANIIADFGRPVLAVKADNMYNLTHDLKEYPEANSVFIFGEFIHYTSKSGDIDQKSILKYLEEKEHQKIEMKLVDPDIEDCFMDLMTKITTDA